MNPEAGRALSTIINSSGSLLNRAPYGYYAVPLLLSIDRPHNSFRPKTLGLRQKEWQSSRLASALPVTPSSSRMNAGARKLNLAAAPATNSAVAPQSSSRGGGLLSFRGKKKAAAPAAASELPKMGMPPVPQSMQVPEAPVLPPPRSRVSFVEDESSREEESAGAATSFSMSRKTQYARDSSPNPVTRGSASGVVDKATREAAIRFKNSLPPKAEVETTGIMSDRTHGSRGRPQGGKKKRIEKELTQKEKDAAVMADKMEEKAKKTEEKGGRLKWKDDATQERNQKLLEEQPPPPASYGSLPNLSGDWVVDNVTGDWDELLKLLKVPEFTRKMAKSRRYGVGCAEQSITMLHDKKSLVVTNRVTNPVYTTNTADNDPAVLLTKSVVQDQMEFRIDGSPQEIRYGSHKGQGTVAWENTALVARFEMGPLGKALLKRTMPDVDTMTLELHVAYITAQRTFKRVDKDVLMRRAMASEEAVLLNA